MVKVAAIQMASGPNVSANLSEAKRLITDAVKQGAQFVVLPENFAHMGMSELDVLEIAEDYIFAEGSYPAEGSSHAEGSIPAEGSYPAEGSSHAEGSIPAEGSYSAEGSIPTEQSKAPIQNFLASLAKEEDIWILGGTIPLKAKTSRGADDSGERCEKILSSCLLFNNKGHVVARYNKIHLFDVDLGEQGGAYNESAFTQPGDEVVVVDTPFGKLGIAICYDLRFPEIFRDMSRRGMEILGLVSSFTATTGKAHWEVLNRARAIENLCFVVSSAQGGYHVNGRETHGDSMIVDPWGGVMEHLRHGSGFAIADIDTETLRKTRKKFPVLEHIKLPCYFNK